MKKNSENEKEKPIKKHQKILFSPTTTSKILTNLKIIQIPRISMVDIVRGAHISDADSDTDSVASTTTNLTVRVFAGGYISPQFTFFLNAIEALHPLMRANGIDLRPVVEIQHVQDIRLL
jgi:hypothetical protein